MLPCRKIWLVFPWALLHHSASKFFKLEPYILTELRQTTANFVSCLFTPHPVSIAKQQDSACLSPGSLPSSRTCVSYLFTTHMLSCSPFQGMAKQFWTILYHHLMTVIVVMIVFAVVLTKYFTVMVLWGSVAFEMFMIDKHDAERKNKHIELFSLL